MPDPSNYKATFKSPRSKYLEYFCQKPASEWTLRNFKKHFQQLKKDPEALYVKLLLTVKEHSRGIPPSVVRDIDKEIANIDKIKSPAPATTVENQYNINKVYGDFVVNNYDNNSNKRQKTRRNNQEENEETFNETWKSFLADEESNRSLHKYSPENNGVLRFAHKLSKRPTMNSKSEVLSGFISALTNNASVELEENIENVANLKDYKFECRFIKKICSLMVIINNKSPSLKYSEAVFNTNLVYPCLSATTVYLKDTSNFKPYFVPGEEPLRAMTEQLTIMGSRADHRKTYHADGVIRVEDLYDLEILLLETSGCFENKSERKISFDNTKGMFALLAMIKTVADRFSYASVDSFRRLRLYFVQASDVYIRLWSIQYINNNVYKFNREDKVLIMEDRNQVGKNLTSLIDFLYHVKSSLSETLDLLKQLDIENEEAKSNNSDMNSQQTLLSDIICPRIFRLTYNIHGKGFGSRPVTSSPESDH